ncbi:GDP-L-fucose synthase [uncultured archaeon]|nr:GDP-L-fucose synthase [uncultured archaeon]
MTTRNSIIREDLEKITDSGLPWQDLEGCTILISGASGFLPAYMVETLLYLNENINLGTKIICLVRDKARAFQRFTDYRHRRDLKILVQDVCKPLHLENHVDFIIHAASLASPKYYGSDPVGILCANSLGTANLLNLAVKSNSRNFLFFSSSEVYGQPFQEAVKENSYGYLDPMDLRSCYAESKRMGETMCISWLHEYGVPSKVVRPFHTYGPGMNLKDGRVYADFMNNILNGTDIILNSDGKAIRSFCYLADATLGFFTVMLSGKMGQAYNIGDDMSTISILELAEMLIGLFPEKRLGIIRSVHVKDPEYLESRVSKICPDISKVRALGWKPETSLEEGLKRTVRSFTCT